ncbi:MAG: helix-turn-helix domain-containing protein [Paludibacteraceae bacterium]
MDKDRIQKVMEQEGLNASQFAAEIGVKSPTLSHILNGRNNPSLDVLKRILDRYREISSDWLILGVGPMFRGIRQPQTLSLFDNEEVKSVQSKSYPIKSEENSVNENSNIQNKEEKNSNVPVEATHNLPPAVKLVKKIIVYYDDNTFQEFLTQ